MDTHTHTSEKCQRPVPGNVSDGERRQMSAVPQNGSQRQHHRLKGCDCGLIRPDADADGVSGGADVCAASHICVNKSPACLASTPRAKKTKSALLPRGAIILHELKS